MSHPSSSSLMHHAKLGICSLILLVLSIFIITSSVYAAPDSLDPTFPAGSGANDWVMALAVQPDGKIVIGGYFTAVNGITRNGIARLNPNGTLDMTFDPGSGTDDWVMALAVQPDGKILIGGYFNSVNGVGRYGITRLHANGTLDTTFAGGSGTNDGVMTLAVQPDGKILIGGYFTVVNGISRSRIARLNSDGTLDTTFAGGSGADDTVWTLGVQPDGKVLIGGYFHSVNGVQRNHMTRLNADGTLDTTFAGGSGADGKVWTTAVQADGKIVVGGRFLTFNGVSRPHIARLQGVSDPPSPTPSPAPTGPRLFLSPATTSIAPNQTFQLTVRIDMAGKVADTVDAYLMYDPAALEVVDAAGNPATSITANSAVVSNVSYNRVNPTTGQIDFSASQYSSPYLSGVATVATIRFRAKTVMGATTIRFVRQGIRRSDLFRGGVSLQALVEHAAIQVQPSTLMESALSTQPFTSVPGHIESDPGFAVRPASKQIRVGEVIALDLVAHLDRRTVATVDVDLMVDPDLVEIVNATGDPISKLRVRHVRGVDVTANVVDGSAGTAYLSVARLRVPGRSGMLTVATVYLRAKQTFTTTPIRVRASGQSYAGGTGPGKPLHLIATGARVTMHNPGHIDAPQIMP
jgi:uncharacterized delta-60 repeat protein